MSSVLTVLAYLIAANFMLGKTVGIGFFDYETLPYTPRAVATAGVSALSELGLPRNSNKFRPLEEAARKGQRRRAEIVGPAGFKERIDQLPKGGATVVNRECIKKSREIYCRIIILDSL